MSEQERRITAEELATLRADFETLTNKVAQADLEISRANESKLRVPLLRAKVAQLEAERSELARVYAEKIIPEWRERVEKLEAALRDALDEVPVAWQGPAWRRARALSTQEDR